jgi:hypothetical protein
MSPRARSREAGDPAPTRTARRHRRHALRAIWSLRVGRPERTQTLWHVYLALTVLMVIGVPVARQLVLWGSRPMLVGVLTAPTTPALALAALGVAGAVAVTVGHQRGPAVLPRFLTATAASNDLPRRHALGRPYLRSLLVLTALTTTGGGLLGGVLVAGNGSGLTVVVTGSLLGLAAGLLLQAAWATGQVAGTAVRRMLSAVLLLATGVLTLTTWTAPVAAGRWAGTMMGTLGTPVGALVPLGVGIAAVCCGHLALDRTRGIVLEQQAARWDSAMTSAGSADLTGAAGTYRARPTAGRHLPAVGGATGPWSLITLYVRRDLVGWMRTPGRTALGVVGVLGGTVLICIALAWFPAVGPLAAAVGTGLGALTMWLASGVFVDGLRHGVETLGAPPLLAQGVGAQTVLHTIAPVLLLASLVLLAGAAFGVVLLVPLLQAAVCIVGRIRDVAKGPMPMRLLAPMLTPEGDVSVLPKVMWQADAPLIALGGGLLLACVGTCAGGPALVLVATLLLAVLAADAARRVRGLSRAAR